MRSGAIVAVTGGKGGTGKSTVAVNLAVAAAGERRLVLADLDVEAPNDHILLGVELDGGGGAGAGRQAVNSMLPFVDYQACIKCGICAEVCDTGAIIMSRERLPVIIPRLCSGCRSCYYACPVKVIEEGLRTIGYTYRAPVSIGGRSFTLVTGSLREGEEHTPPLVVAARRRALSEPADLYVVDTAPGTSNTVSTALSGAKLAIAVTEPTPLGAYDLDMLLEVAAEMGVEAWVVVNRYGIGPSELVEDVAKKYGVKVAAHLPYSREVVDSYVASRPIVSWRPSSEPAEVLMELAKSILEVS